MADERSEVSVGIPAYGSCPTLVRVVELLLAQTVQPVEIIVVHSGPDDPTARLAGTDGRVRVIHRETRLFAGAARNIAADHARCGWLAFIDADVLPRRDWLAKLLAAARARPGRYVVGSVGYAESGGYWGLALWTIEFASVFPFRPDQATTSIAAGNFLVPAAAFARVGGFPSGFAAAEDTILAAKLRADGLTPWFCAVARVDHVNIVGFSHFAAHLFLLGRHAALARRALPLRGRVATRFWPLACALFLSKFAETYTIALRWGRGCRWLFLALAPGVFLGALIWNFGLLSGLRVTVPSVDRDRAAERLAGTPGGAGAPP